MIKKMILRSFFALAALALVLTAGSCRKGPGPGGQCSISGKVFVKNFRTDSGCLCYQLKEEYYAQGDYVYISFGDEKGVGDFVRTADDGSYLFEFLLPGKYKVYSISRDTSLFTSNSKRYAVIKEVEITGRREEVVLEDIVILK